MLSRWETMRSQLIPRLAFALLPLSRPPPRPPPRPSPAPWSWSKTARCRPAAKPATRSSGGSPRARSSSAPPAVPFEMTYRAQGIRAAGAGRSGRQQGAFPQPGPDPPQRLLGLRREPLRPRTLQAGRGQSSHLQQTGIVNVFCNVHHSMVGYIAVLETPVYASAEADGKFELKVCRPAPAPSPCGRSGPSPRPSSSPCRRSRRAARGEARADQAAGAAAPQQVRPTLREATWQSLLTARRRRSRARRSPPAFSS